MLMEGCHCGQNAVLGEDFEIALHQRGRVGALGVQRSFVEDRKSNIFVCHHLHFGLISPCLHIPCRALNRGAGQPLNPSCLVSSMTDLVVGLPHDYEMAGPYITAGVKQREIVGRRVRWKMVWPTARKVLATCTTSY